MVCRSKLLLLGGLLGAKVAAYLAWRPAMLRWGTEGDEATESLPGDDLLPNPRVQSTRAISIDAPPERVWPWIVQMGIYRAGLYISAAFEGLAADAPTAAKLLAFTFRHVPGWRLLARGVDFFVGDPLHHYMEVGVLRGTKERAEGKYEDVGHRQGPTPAAVEPVATAT